MKLSLLDLVYRAENQTSNDALAASTTLAQAADELGFERFWVAEHHNSMAVSSTVPSVLLAHLGALTSRIKLGSGGVMLPNHPPLSVAEQFALLESLHPGRIDLGIGRAPGTDPVTSYLLRAGHTNEDGAQEQFPDDVAAVAALLGIGIGSDSVDNPPAMPPQVSARIQDRNFQLRATPALTSSPTMWLLGSSTYSARLAAQLGLPYIFANHFGIPGLDSMLTMYRSNFQPSATLAAPATLIPVTTVIAPTEAEAQRRALPHLLSMARLRAGVPQGPVPRVERAEAALEDGVSDRMQETMTAMRPHMVIGTPESVASQLRALLERVDADEAMLALVTGFTLTENPADNEIRTWGIRALQEVLHREDATTFPLDDK